MRVSWKAVDAVVDSVGAPTAIGARAPAPIVCRRQAPAVGVEVPAAATVS